MNYKGIELEDISGTPQIFNPPRKMLVWKDGDTMPCIDSVYAIGPSSMDLQVRAISENGRMGTHCYKHCAEIPKPRRATKQELARWIAQGNGEWKEKYGDYVYVYVRWDAYRETEANEPCSDKIVIRKWDDNDWHEPTIDYIGISEVG